MRITTYLTLIIISLFATSCEYDYDVDKHFGTDFTPQVVLNSIINPDSTIKANIFWTKKNSDTSEFKRVAYTDVKLYKNGALILETESIDGKLNTNVYPEAGATYKMELIVPDYGVVTAKTYIPQPPSSSLKLTKIVEGYSHYNTYCHMEIANLTLNEKRRSVIIKSNGIYEHGVREDSRNYYIDNALCDQFNATNDPFDVAERGSNISHEEYLRVPYANISAALPLNFSIAGFGTIYTNIIIGEDEWGYPLYEYTEYKCTDIKVNVISPSDEYDKYLKSAYQQDAFDFDMPIFNEPIPVHSNVENGLGIFAGYTATTLNIELDTEE